MQQKVEEPTDNNEIEMIPVASPVKIQVPQPKLIVNKFEKIQEVGEGAYGKVILCKEIATGREVAVKVVS